MSDFNYIDAEFKKVHGGDFKLKIISKNGETRWLNIDHDDVANIQAMLAKKEEGK